MPIRDRIIWGDRNPLSDPRYAGLDQFVSNIRKGRLPPNVKGGRIFHNADNDLPAKPDGYYTEYDVEPTVEGKDRGKYRLVLGKGGEVYITGNHYRDFRQIVNMPTEGVEDKRIRALDKLSDLRRGLANQVDQYRSEHQGQLAILTNTDTLKGAAIGFVGYWVNRWFNSEPPPLLIWDNALGRLLAAQNAIKKRDVKEATKQLLLARSYHLLAMKKYLAWKNGIEPACEKMKSAIVVVAAAAALAAVGAFAVGAVVDGAGAATAEQTMARIAVSLERADAAIRIAETTSIAEELAAQRELEAAIEEFMRLQAF